MWKENVPTPPGDRIWMPSPFETDIFRMSENVLDDRRRSANAIRPCTDNFRRSRSIGPDSGGSTGNESDDLLFDICSWSTSFSSVMVGVNWFLALDFSSGVRSMVSGVTGVFWLSSSGSDMQIRFTDKLSGLIDFGISSVDVFWMGIQEFFLLLSIFANSKSNRDFIAFLRKIHEKN